MTPDERQMLSGLFDRIRSTTQGPRDQEADSYIAEQVRANPSAAYVLSQTVLVQQQALEAAARRISEMESQAHAGGQGQPEGSFLGNLGRSLFGGGATQATPPAQIQRPYDSSAYQRDPGYQQRPQYAPPPPQGGPWGGGAAAAAPQGGGFLHGALQTATGVAGGMLAANALEGLLGGHRGGMFGGGFGGGGFGGPGETTNETVNNYYGTDPAAQQAQDYLQDQDQDQDAAQDAGDSYDTGGGGGGDDWT